MTAVFPSVDAKETMWSTCDDANDGTGANGREAQRRYECAGRERANCTYASFRSSCRNQECDLRRTMPSLKILPEGENKNVSKSLEVGCFSFSTERKLHGHL